MKLTKAVLILVYLMFCFKMAQFGQSKADRECNKRKDRCQTSVLLTKTHGSIQSPGYPTGYSNNREKSWHIRLPKGYRVRLRFRKQFHIEDSPLCQKDALIVSFDKNFKDTKLLCGSSRPRGVTSPRNELWLKFRTDDNGVAKGFMANYRAIDVNECKKEVCKFPSLCRNTVGSYMCDCPDGYKLQATGHKPRGRKNAGKCVDIDECATNMAKCDFQCVNTAGSYHCVCPRGYKLAYNEKSCRDINECAKNNGGCSHQCLNTRGTHSCACPPGYKLDALQRTCQKEIFFDSYQKITFVKEDAPVGTVITRIKAKPSKKFGEKITYSIVAENLKPTTTPPTFLMDKRDGDIKVNRPLDRETISEYLLEIEARYVSTNGSNSAKIVTKARSFVAVRVLDVNDNAPRFSHPSYAISVPCDVRPGSVLYRLVTFDDDQADNARVTYKLEPSNPYFTVQRHSGKVKVLRGLRAFCNESKPDNIKEFEYRVVATDHGSPSLKTRVKVTFIVAAIDLRTQTMFVWYSQGSDFKVVQKKPGHRKGLGQGRGKGRR